jgi:nicotinamidase-related amidase
MWSGNAGLEGDASMGWVSRDKPLGRVFVDLSTQHDFVDADGALPIVNREPFLESVQRLMALIRSSGLRMISAVEIHRFYDTFHGIMPHCIEGTRGQQKLEATLLTPRIVVHADNSFDLPHHVMSRYQQVIFRKLDRDLFANPKADRLLTDLNPPEYVVFGVGLEKSVKAVALGLLMRHKKVAVVSDTTGYWNEADADLTFRKLDAKGIRLTTVTELVDLLRPIRRRVRARIRTTRRHDPAVRGATARRDTRVDSLAR